MSLSSRPYLLRALYDWMTDNKLTPQVLVNTSTAGVRVPPPLRDRDQVMLNISLAATQGLVLGDEQLHFETRFGGVSELIVLPIESIVAIVARETEAAMIFGNEPDLSRQANTDEVAVVDEPPSMQETTPIMHSEDNVVHVKFGRDPAEE